MSYYLKELIDMRRNFIKAYDSKKYPEALELGTKIVNLYKENDACSSEEYAEDLNNLAIVYDDMHFNDKAKELYKEAAKLKKELIGEDSQSYLDTLTNLGILNGITGEFTEAEEILKTVISKTRENTGLNTEEYVESLYNLGNMYVDNGKYDKAVAMLSEALECAKRVKDYDLTEFIDIHVSIAEACAKNGNYRRACDEYGRARKTSQRSNEKDTYFKMNYMLNYANVFQRLEKYDSALDILEEAIAIREGLMDTKHLDFISMLNMLASVYCKNEDFQKAIEVHERVLRLVEEMLGKNHVFYGDVLTSIGVDYAGMKNYEKAIEYHNRALDMKRENVGEKHQHYIYSLLSLAEVYEDMEKFDRAIEIQNIALELRREAFGEIDENISDSLVNLGRLHMEAGDLIKAQGFFMQALIMSKELMIASGINVRCYAENVRLMAEACCRRRDEEKTKQFCENYISLRKTKYGDEHPKYAKALFDSAAMLEEIGDYEKASEYLEEASMVAEMMCGFDTTFGMECLYHSGDVLLKLKNYSEASDRLKKAAAVYKKNNGDEVELIKIMFLQAKSQYMLGFPRKAEECVFRAEGIASRSKKDMSFIINEQLEFARVMMAAGDYDKALEILDKLCSRNLEEIDEGLAYEILSDNAESNYNCQMYSRALERAEQALKFAKSNVDMADIKLLISETQLKFERYLEAAQQLEEIKSLIDEDEKISEKYKTIVYCMLGEVYFNLKEYEKADSVLEEGLAEAKKKENIAESEYKIFLDIAAETAQNLKLYSKAVEYLSEIALLVHRSEGETIRFAEYLSKTAQIYCEQKRYSEAVVMYEKISEIYKKAYSSDSEEYLKVILDMCGAYACEQKFNEIIKLLEDIDFNSKAHFQTSKKLSDMLALSYKNTGAFTKLIKLKFGEKQ